jgi:hypothetical protein
MTRAMPPQFLAWRAPPRPIHHCSKAIFEKRMDGGGSRRVEALLPLKARRIDRDVCVQFRNYSRQCDRRRPRSARLS